MKTYKLELFRTDLYHVEVSAESFEEAVKKASNSEDLLDWDLIDTESFRYSDDFGWVYNEEAEDWEEVDY